MRYCYRVGSPISCGTSTPPGAAHQNIIEFGAEDDERGISAEVAMQWNNGFAESVYTFANTINTTEGGTHEEGFRAALTSLVNRFARDWGVLKEKDPNLSGEDIREGLTAIVSVKLREPPSSRADQDQTRQHRGQGLRAAGGQRVPRRVVRSGTRRRGKEIARKSQQASVARIAARKARDLARGRKGLLGGSTLPGKLIDCSSHNPEECEVFIVEGDSAGGSARSGRDPRTQAILPIRGKILNVESPGSTRCWPTTRCRRSFRPWAQACRRSLTPTNCATTSWY